MKKKLLKKDFLIEVMAEIDNIKMKATPEEINNLNIELLIPNSPTRCIYGQMTGHCKSERAQALTPKLYYRIGNGENFRDQDFSKHETFNRFTPLEKYLYMINKEMLGKIIGYLKNEINTLNLK